MLKELRRGEFAFENVDLRVPFEIAARRVVLQLDGVNDNQACIVANRGESQAARRRNQPLRLPRLGPGRGHRLSGENGDLREIVAGKIREGRTGCRLVAGRLQQRGQPFAGPPVRHFLQQDHVGLQRVQDRSDIRQPLFVGLRRRRLGTEVQVPGGDAKRFRVNLRNAEEEQKRDQPPHSLHGLPSSGLQSRRKSGGWQKNFESLRVHKPAQLTSIRLVFSFAGVKRQRQGVRTVKACEMTRPAGVSSTDAAPVGVSPFGSCRAATDQTVRAVPGWCAPL